MGPPTIDEPTDDDTGLPLVCAIGASAGGLAPIEAFFDAMPDDTGMAFVVVQHLSPDHESLMARLLEGHTAMPIRSAADGDLVEANRVYLIPPATEITIAGGHLALRDREQDRREPPRPVDVFFSSLAHDRADRCIAVVLSGTGSDGAAGLEQVRRAGGLTLAQDVSAEFGGMPDSARGTGFVDASLPPHGLASACVAFSRSGVRPEAEDERPAAHTSLPEMIAILQRSTGISFDEYRLGTLRRRIERRVQLDADGDHDAYLDRLRSDAALASALAEDVLIDVTGFFRDGEVFDLLERTVIPRLVDEAVREDRPIRAWVAGCATGEEAYSLAILLLEASDDLGPQRPSIRVFATDVHETSLRVAAAGAYPSEAMQSISQRRLDRFFDASNDGWRVRPELRNSVTFSQHDLLVDPPFTRIDLVSCRNVLIYFEGTAQRRVLRAANFALRPGGALVIGPSETVGPIAADFEAVSETWRVFDKRIDASRAAMPTGSSVRVPARAPAIGVDQRLILAYDAVLDAHFVGGLLLNDRRELLHTVGAATEWLGQPRGRTTLDALSLVREQGLRMTLGAVLRELEAGAERAEHRSVLVGADRERVEVSGARVRVGTSDYYLLHGVPASAPQTSAPYGEVSAATPTTPDATDQLPLAVDYVEQLEAELAYTRESLQAAIEEQETSNEELSASNEELIAANEELQSTNEELSSVNEELRTLNDENRQRLEQVVELSADLEQLMSAVDIGVVFLAEDRTIRRFNERASDYFRIRDDDIGRTLDDVVVAIEGVDLLGEIDRVSHGEAAHVTHARSVLVPDQRLMVRIDRYDGSSGEPGVLIAVVDLTDLLVAREERALAAFLQDSPLSVAIWDPDDRIRYRSRSVVEGEMPIAYREEDLPPAPTELLTGEVAAALERARTSGEVSFGLHVNDGSMGRGASADYDESLFVFHPFEFRGDALIGAMAVPLRLVEGLVDQKLRSSVLNAMSEHPRFSSMLLDLDGHPLARGATSTADRPADGPAELTAAIQQRADDPQALLDACRRVVLDRRSESFWYEGVTRDGARRVTHAHIVPITDSDVIGGLLFGVEIADLVERQEHDAARIAELSDEVARLRAELAETRRSGREWATDLAERNADLDNFAHVAAHDLKAPIRSVRSFAEMAAEEIAEDSPAHPRLERILDASNRMTSLVDSLLDFASVDRDEPAPGPVDVATVIDDLLVDLRESIESTGALIDVVVTAGTAVHGDETGIRQVLTNLVQNAIKFSDGAPMIRISTRALDGGIVIDVADRGIGFDQALADQAFEPFQRLHDTSVSGNGVGLAICRRIVERRGGRLWAVSEVGEGSTFSVWLPAGDRRSA